MKARDIDRFFETLSQHWTLPTRITLTGGGAALLMGGARPTDDVDYEVSLEPPDADREVFQHAVRSAQESTGINAQFSESIERWSEISLLDYRKHTMLYKRFGSLEIRLLDPLYWSIGKIARYWDQDVQDLVAVFSRTKPDPLTVAALWHRALHSSPASSSLFLVKQQAIHFFTHHGRTVWGKRFDPAAVTQLLEKR